MKIHALTLSWNGQSLLEALQPGLAQNLKHFDWNWYIRDNGSKDRSVELAQSWAQTAVLPISHNRANFAEGVNSLVEFANPSNNDLLLLINNDLVFRDQESLGKMIALWEKTQAAVVGARLLFPQSQRLTHAGVVRSPSHGSMPWHLKVNQECTPIEKKNRYFQAVTGALLLTPVSAFREAGGLDTQFHWSFEDIDYCYYHSSRQKKVVYCGETEVEHGTSISLKKNPVHLLNMNSNVQRFKQKWSSMPIDEDLYLRYPNYLLV